MPTADRHRPVRAAVAVLAVAAAAALAGCGADSNATPAPAVSSSSAVPVAPVLARVGDLQIAAGYVPAPASDTVAAAYFTVINSGSSADALVRASSDAATSVTLHRTEGGSMVPLAELDVPAGGVAAFSPGADHLMLEHPTRTLEKGGRVTLTLVFRTAGTVTVTVPVTGYPVNGALPSDAMTPLPSAAAS